MHCNSKLIVLSVALLTFAAAPSFAQDHGSHPPHPAGGGSGSHTGGTWAGHIQGTGTGTSSGTGGHNGGSHHQGRPSYNHGYGYGYSYANPYGWGTPVELPYDSEYDQLEGRGTLDHPQAADQPDTRMGPTVFEHNGQASTSIPNNRGAQSYQSRATYDQAESAKTAPDPNNPTLLVFRDGHQQEVSNYAIAGANLIVLGGKSQKIPLSDLDLGATSKANADRGVDFKTPNQS